MTGCLFSDISPLAERHPRSDRLILAAKVRSAAIVAPFDEEELAAAHEIIIRWADLESSGRLAEIHETQMQGDFLAQVFGEALGYVLLTEGQTEWQLEQHWAIPGIRFPGDPFPVTYEDPV